jgi:2-polyprenyl-6-methoxyphenol hydroxylase-like FAD-dependent oxidoreductase
MNKPHVLISGAGIAGPALALCLQRHGYATTVVERAPALREGGQAVDFRGPVHREVLERLDLWQAIHAARTDGSTLSLLDPAGRTFATLPEVMMSGDVEILRGDLARILYERTRQHTEYRFGDRITRLAQHEDGVAVEFARGAPARFDLVVGADGLHSGVRALAFAPEARVLRHHGYRIATFAVPGWPRAVVYSVPGRAVCIIPSSKTQARALLVYEAPPFADERRDPDEQKPALRRIFADLGWEVPRVLAALEQATDLYVDAIATVHVDRFAHGRVALLGDAAYGGTLGGQGTSLAVVGAYVLAGELARGDGPEAALARYEAVMRPYATQCQKGAMRAGAFFAPTSRAGLWLRNRLYQALTSPRLVGLFERMVKHAATDFALPAYAA